MAIDGVGGKQHTDIKMHDKKSLGIQENSKEALIFNEIDESDGVKDGKLSDFQLFKYNVRTTLAEEREKQIAEAKERTEKANARYEKAKVSKK